VRPGRILEVELPNKGAQLEADLNMGFKPSDLWRKPVVNPVNNKARSVPVLNPLDRHGRVFFFSWLGFMIAFWAWYTFPPLVSLFSSWYSLPALSPMLT